MYIYRLELGGHEYFFTSFTKAQNFMILEGYEHHSGGRNMCSYIKGDEFAFCQELKTCDYLGVLD